MTKAIVELEKLVACLESEKRLRLQTNEKVLQRSSLTTMLPSGARNSLVNSVSSEVSGIAVKVGHAIRKWCKNEFLELKNYAEQNKRDWTNHRETELDGSVVR